jgi:mono/diheme cytochrome c family protein
MTGLILLAMLAAPPWAKPRAVARALFLENCAVCHETVKPKSAKIGPSLARFKKVPAERAEPFQKYIVNKIRDGGFQMPAFKDSLSEAQMKAIASFLLPEPSAAAPATSPRK